MKIKGGKRRNGKMTDSKIQVWQDDCLADIEVIGKIDQSNLDSESKALLLDTKIRLRQLAILCEIAYRVK
jgi:hypothetical protein